MLRNNRCNDCGLEVREGKKERFNNDGPHVCCICNNTKGRGIKYKEHKDDKIEVCYCFKCAREKREIKLTEEPTSYATQEEAQYYNALLTHFHEPLFYGKEPDYKLIHKLAWKMNEKIMAEQDEERREKQGKRKMIEDNNLIPIWHVANKVLAKQG